MRRCSLCHHSCARPHATPAAVVLFVLLADVRSEMAMAIRMSMEEERQRQQKASGQTESTPAAAAAGGADAPVSEKEHADCEWWTGIRWRHGALDDSSRSIDFLLPSSRRVLCVLQMEEDEDALLAQAIALSMQENQDAPMADASAAAESAPSTPAPAPASSAVPASASAADIDLAMQVCMHATFMAMQRAVAVAHRNVLVADDATRLLPN